MLSGCAELSVLISHHTAQPSLLHKTCLQSPVLVADLTLPRIERKYVLPNGQVCPNKG